MARLSALGVEKLQPPAQGRSEIHDDTPGLVLRVTANGVKSFSFKYQRKGRLRRLTLGQYPGLSLGEARKRAWELRAATQRGEDPVEEKKKEEREAQLNRFDTCVDEFIEKYAKPKNKTWHEMEQVLDRLVVPVWGERPVKDIHRRDVVDLLDDVARKTPYQSNLVRAHVSRLFNWLIEREVVEGNPVIGVAPRQKPIPRDRILTDQEIAALWRATQRMGGTFGSAIRFLLLTGMRRDEASYLRWDELDGDWAAMPGTRLKAGRDFRAPLSSSAKTIVDAQPKVCPFVFTTNAETGISGWTRAKENCDRFMSEELRGPVAEWRIHDLRRTVGSGLARLGYSIEVRKRVLGHVPRASDPTTATYTWHHFDKEAMEAVTKWAAFIGDLTSTLRVIQTA